MTVSLEYNTEYLFINGKSAQMYDYNFYFRNFWENCKEK